MFSSGQEFDEKFLDSKHVLKVYFKPSRKNQDFGFLPLPSKLVRLTNPYLIDWSGYQGSLIVILIGIALGMS